MKKRIIILAAVLLLSGCNIENDEKIAEESAKLTTVTTAMVETQTTSAVTTTTTAMTTTTYLAIDEVIPDAIQTPRVEGDRLSYTIINIYSFGEYYTMEVSGVKLTDDSVEDIDTTYIGDELYGDFRLDLKSNGDLIDSYKINVPRDDRFLILESVAQGLTYGSELISNKRQYKVDDYPDLLQLDFYVKNEVETPQYARYFAIYDEKIIEIPVLSGGVEIAPHGTHLEFESEGVLVQYVVESDSYGNYFVQKYRFTFDPENRCLNRKKVNY